MAGQLNHSNNPAVCQEIHQFPYHLCFLILVISQGHCEFLGQHMKGKTQLIIVGIKD